MLLKDLLEEFILELQIQNYSPRTMKSYRNNNLLMFTFIEKEFGMKEIEKVKPIHIKTYIKFLQRNKIIVREKYFTIDFFAFGNVIV